jgi:hypothetical protein
MLEGIVGVEIHAPIFVVQALAAVWFDQPSVPLISSMVCQLSSPRPYPQRAIM